MSTLAVIDTDQLPDIQAAVTDVEQLIADSNSETLNEARARAEAHALYEKRAGHVERETHFKKLKLLTEAGLGCISFDDPDLIDKNRRGPWRTLAAAFERGALLNLADRFSDGRLIYEIQQRGYTYVPGKTLGCRDPVPWAKARVMVKEQGLDPRRVERDESVAKRRRDAMERSAARLHRLRRAAERLDRIQRQGKTASAAKQRGTKTAEAYALLRRLLQVLHEAQHEFGPEERKRVNFDYLFADLYAVEDHLGAVLRDTSRECGQPHERLDTHHGREPAVPDSGLEV